MLILLPFMLTSQDPDWRVRLKNFDEVFQPPSITANQSEPTAQRATTANPDADLGEAQTPVTSSDVDPPAMSADDFKAKFPTIVASVSINMGATVPGLRVQTIAFFWLVLGWLLHFLFFQNASWG